MNVSKLVVKDWPFYLAYLTNPTMIIIIISNIFGSITPASVFIIIFLHLFVRSILDSSIRSKVCDSTPQLSCLSLYLMYCYVVAEVMFFYGLLIVPIWYCMRLALKLYGSISAVDTFINSYSIFFSFILVSGLSLAALIMHNGNIEVLKTGMKNFGISYAIKKVFRNKATSIYVMLLHCGAYSMSYFEFLGIHIDKSLHIYFLLLSFICIPAYVLKYLGHLKKGIA